MPAALIALCLTLFAGASQAEETIYRWTGSDGKTYYGDMPPRDARNLLEVDSRFGKSKSELNALSEIDSAADETRRAECSSKTAQLKTFKTATKLVEKDSLGREREFTSAERQLLIERTQADLDAQCADFQPAP